VADRKGVIWFLETQGNKLGRLNPRDGAIREFELPSRFESPRDLALDASGALWFGGHMGRNLMVFSPATLKFKSYPMPGGGVIESLIAAADGKLYFSLRTSSKIGVFDPATRKFLELDVSVGKSQPNGIAVDSRGNIWFADTEKNVLVRMDAAMVRKLWLQ
jgi:virginiamycin B lyase